MIGLSTGQVDSLIARIPDRLEQIVEDENKSNWLMFQMNGMASVEFALRKGRTTRTPGEVEVFWARIGEAFSRKPDLIGQFVVQSNRFGTFQPDDWGLLCSYRSATEILRERYSDTFEQGMCPSVWEELEEMDDEFRKLAPDQEPYSPVAIPEGVPESHWWWYLPRQLREVIE